MRDESGGAPWWAGAGPIGGAVLAAAGVAVLVWLLVSGRGAGEDWASYYGAGKVLAIGCVVLGGGMVARRRR